jgi:hypothetical protein
LQGAGDGGVEGFSRERSSGEPKNAATCLFHEAPRCLVGRLWHGEQA